MTEERIIVGDAVENDEEIALPVIDVLAGRGFVTGKSGSGKSNTASVIAEKLLDNGYGLLIVDIDGEYYGLKEEYELLHVGADEECDIHVTPDHAEKLASLALEQNVPIILDVSSYLDESDANEMVLEVTKHLFAKEKMLKKPFLMLVEEVHEYIPEGGGMDETGKMLIKVGKRGRKHGLGIVGISQRPADVKKDFITQCDWLVWHRLTWNNDTKVVGRILGSDYADAIEDMGDGEAFLMTDWAEEIRRVQFRRKQTFDAGATPGLDDFERPDLKSVSGDLVSELTEISDEKERHESELADVRQELDKKRQRINELEQELEEAQDLSKMADTFAQALLQKAEAPYRQRGPQPETPVPSPVPDASDDVRARIEGTKADAESVSADQRELHEYERPPRADEFEAERADADDEETDDRGNETTEASRARDADATGSPESSPDDGVDAGTADGGESEADGGESGVDGNESEINTVEVVDGVDAADAPVGPRPVRVVAGDGSGDTAVGDAEEPADSTSGGSETESEAPETVAPDATSDVDRLTALVDGVELRETETVVRGFARAIEQLDDVTRGMLGHYCRAGVSSPIDAHVSAGGSGDRHWAYARNRTLRQAGLVEHAMGGSYRYCLPTLVAEVFADGVDGQTLADSVAAIEVAAGLREE